MSGDERPMASPREVDQFCFRLALDFSDMGWKDEGRQRAGHFLVAKLVMSCKGFLTVVFPVFPPSYALPPLNHSQRQAFLDRYVNALAQRFALDQGLDLVCTVRKLPPPAFPGEKPGSLKYFINASRKGSSTRSLLEFTPAMYALVLKAQRWVENAKGPPPPLPGKARERVKN